MGGNEQGKCFFSRRYFGGILNYSYQVNSFDVTSISSLYVALFNVFYKGEICKGRYLNPLFLFSASLLL